MAMINSGAVVANMVPRQGRVNRNPRHTFNVRFRPHEITPILIAPVLPGETMKSAVLQLRAVTDPLKFPLVGWWLEVYVFYVKLRDLVSRDIYEAMMLDPTTDVSTLRHPTGTYEGYIADDDMSFTTQALRRVVEEYFRADGEAWDAYTIGSGRPAAAIRGESWLDSVVDKTTFETATDVVIETDRGTGDAVTASQIDAAMRQWQFLNINGMTNMTYEDYLMSFGIRTAQKEELFRPEVLRFVRDWQYPSNTINSSTGAPTSAVSWSMQESINKARFFKEPGFLYAVTLARPKSYLKNQKGSAVGLMDNAYAWLPAVLAHDHRASLKEVANNNGPLQDTTNPYIVDIRDLFLYGDQYINYDPAAITGLAPFASLPNAALTNKRYPTAADVSSWYVTATTNEFVRMDGVVEFTIAGTQVDMT